MGWSTEYRYKILGHKISYEDETIYIFDLTETEIFEDKKRKKKGAENDTVPVHSEGSDNPFEAQGEAAVLDNDSRRKESRRPFYPSDWKNSFGLPVEEHRKALEVNIQDGYVEFATSE